MLEVCSWWHEDFLHSGIRDELQLPGATAVCVKREIYPNATSRFMCIVCVHFVFSFHVTMKYRMMLRKARRCGQSSFARSQRAERWDTLYSCTARRRDATFCESSELVCNFGNRIRLVNPLKCEGSPGRSSDTS